MADQTFENHVVYFLVFGILSFCHFVILSFCHFVIFTTQIIQFIDSLIFMNLFEIQDLEKFIIYIDFSKKS
jgi:hypothetical protein